MIFQRNSKIPHLIYFLYYLIYYNIIWEIIITSLLELITKEEINVCGAGALLFTTIWIKWDDLLNWINIIEEFTGIIDSIEIEENSRQIYIVSFVCFFIRRKKVYSIDDDNFTYDYIFRKEKILRNKLTIPYTSACIHFYEKRKVQISLYNINGWNIEQLKEICAELKKYKDPTCGDL